MDEIRARALQSVPVKAQFKDVAKWKGSLSARFLILLDAPSFRDFTETELILDREEKYTEAFAPIINRIFAEDEDETYRQFAVISCCVGWKRNAYRTVPTAPELQVSMPYVEEVIMQMPNLKLIIATGPYSAELCLRNFDVHEMFLCSKKEKLTDFHEPHPSIRNRKNNDKILNTVVRRAKCVRYMYTPPIYHAKDFAAFTPACLWNVPKLREFELRSEPFDVRSDQLGFPDDERYLTYRQFKAAMHESLRAVVRSRHEGTDGRVHPTYVMVNAYDDPYHAQPNGNKYVCVFDMQYDTVRNQIYLYGSTPTGTPIYITVSNLTFTFWIRPHVAFAASSDLWLNRKTGRPLYGEDLEHLQQIIATKCKFAFKKREAVCNGDSFRLSVDSKVDMHDGAWSTRSTEFIRVDVAHYAFIDEIVKVLRKVVDAHGKIVPEKDDLRGYYDTRLDFYQIFKPEKMFGERYNVQMSQWHRIDALQMDAPATVSKKTILPHATHLVARLQLPAIGNPIACLSPYDGISLEHEGMTSSDMAPDVRGSFDIEVSKFGKKWGTPLDAPIICICICVRKHDPRTSKFQEKTFIPESGYEYYVFTLGTIDKTTTDETLVGQEHVFQFAREDDMLKSYFYFYSLLKARYYASHNGKAFDIPFVLNRAKTIGLTIPSMGYTWHQSTRIVQTQFQSRAFGEKTVSSIEGEMGIDQVDTLELFMREKKLRSYRLGALAEMYVGMTKSDMPYSAIMGHFRQDDSTRRVLVDYCIRDAQLPDQLLSHGQWITSAVELSRASGGVSVATLNEKGMQEKVLGATLQVFRKKNLPYIIRTNAHWTKQFNAEIVEAWLLEKDEKKEKEVEDENEVVAVEKAPTKRQRPGGISSFFQSETKIGSARQTEKKATQAELRAAANAAMAKAKNERGGDNTRKAEYQGAVVMDVDKGWFYERPLGCLDFAALYPSIMMSENHGPNTKVYGDELAARGFTEDDCYKMPDFQVRNPRTNKQVDVYFLKPEVEAGVYAVVEMYLVGLRGAAKKKMAIYANQFEKDNVTPNPNYDYNKFSIYNQQQNNLKIYANSLYGTMGATGVLSDKDIAGSVTAVGRYSINKVRDRAEREYGGICRGGDTDSVFMEFPGLPEGHYEKRWAEACARPDNADRPAEFPGVPDGWYRIDTVEEMERFADEELEATINSMFKAPMKIEYEKAMCCAICIAKKRYIFIMCERGKKPYIAFKGIEVVRRDSLPFLTRLMKRVFDILMKMRQPGVSMEEYREAIARAKKEACDIIREQARLLVNGKVGIHDLILSKMRSREYYANEKQEHLTVVKKMEKRGMDPPSVGSRVYYVYTHQAAGEKAVTKEGKKNAGELKGSLIADDPEWVIQKRIPINYLYYFEHKFKEPIIRIMRYFLYPEMTTAVLKRKMGERQATISEALSKKRRMVEDDEVQVTLKELTEETDRFLFGTASRRSHEYKNLQSRYGALRDRVVSSAFIDQSNVSSIAHFARRERTRLEHLRVEYEGDNDYAILAKEQQKHLELVEQHKVALAQCRSCLKIGDEAEVECAAMDCSKYMPRITLSGDVIYSRDNLDVLITDIEDLTFSNVASDDLMDYLED